MLYEAESSPVKNSHIHKMSVVEMRMLRWMCGILREIGLGTKIFGIRQD